MMSEYKCFRNFTNWQELLQDFREFNWVYIGLLERWKYIRFIIGICPNDFEPGLYNSTIYPSDPDWKFLQECKNTIEFIKEKSIYSSVGLPVILEDKINLFLNISEKYSQIK